MRIYSPVWIAIAVAVLVQTSGTLSTVGSALIGVDNAIKATIDLKAMVAKIVPPVKIVPIKPVVVPQRMPTKAPRK